tara:strand:- start:329 stop:1162 length:834 start_codon:yes stop_codon:yes gene_type:complete
MTQEAILITTTPPLPGLTLVNAINSANLTIATDFAGSTDPAADSDAYMTWADTSTGFLKRRNAANNAWSTIARIYPATSENAAGYIQNLTSNTATVVSTLPNGTATTSGLNAFNNSDAANAAKAILDISTSALRISADKTGTGSYLPVLFYTSATERLNIGINGTVTVKKRSVGEASALTSSAASIAVDASASNNFTHTFTENTTLANPSNLVAGQSGVIVFTQHASSPKTLAFASYWDFPGGTVPTITASNSAVDVLAYYVNSATSITARVLGDVK